MTKQTSKLVRRGKEDHHILIDGTIHQEDTTIINIYPPNITELSFIKKKKTLRNIQERIGPNMLIVGNLDIPLPSIDRSSRLKKKSTKTHQN